MFTFKNGMATLPKAIHEEFGNNVLLNSKVTAVNKTDSKYIVYYKTGEELLSLEADLVISTAPSYATSKIFGSMDPELDNHLNNIYYPPVLVLYLGYDKSNISQPLDGFGFLIPEKEKKKFLGALWSSVIFDNRAPENKAAFTLFIGGARSPELFENDDDNLIQDVINEFQKIMGIKGGPEFIKSKFWKRAIPQYNIGYIKHEEYFNMFEEKNPGIILGGNYVGGISVGDCIKSSEVLFNKAKERLK
jgi:oxygen-dependent protoporphyrinogen oxidase